ncbi:MAG: SGNH/GDSL hydrolase family protein [Cyanosarcina radialis HA8281-LM2]|nr:SGNH/GDSL hydrolase family protein [Cyanosarcina radialis HA8281-LM2]
MKSHTLKSTLTISALTLSLAWAQPSAAEGSSFRRLYIFGDSLSDPGNVYTLTGRTVPPSPPYFQGRTSNGPLWTEYFASNLGLLPTNLVDVDRFPPTEGINFAFVGATSSSKNVLNGSLFGLQQQIAAFSQLPRPRQTRTLYAVWIGANDYLSLFPADPNRWNLRQTPQETVRNISVALTALAKAKAKTILVFNLSDLGQTPFGRSNPSLSQQLTLLTKIHNWVLRVELLRLRQQFPGTEFILVDIDRLFKTVVREPQKFHFTNVTTSCLNLQVNPPQICDRPDEYLFWDGIHPTHTGHRIIAQKAFQTLNSQDSERQSESAVNF